MIGPWVVHRVWTCGQSLAVGPAAGIPVPPECPLAAVPMWLHKSDTLNYSAFTPLEQPVGFGHGPELQCGIDMYKADISNIQIVIARGATLFGSWAPGGTWYPWVAEDVPEVLAACNTNYPDSVFVDHMVFNGGQSEATSDFDIAAQAVTTSLLNVVAGYEALIGHAFNSIHIDLTQIGLINGTWIDIVRSKELAYPRAFFILYDDLPTTDGTHPNAFYTNILGGRQAISLIGAINMGTLGVTARNKLIDHARNIAAYAPAVTQYLHLYADAAGTVPLTSGSAPGYVALSKTNNGATWAATSGLIKANAAAFVFATPTGTWPDVLSWKLTTSATEGSGDLLASDSHTAVPVNVVTGPISYPIGAITITAATSVSVGGASPLVVAQLLDLMFGAVANVALATTHGAWYAGDPEGAGTIIGGSVPITQATTWGAASGGRALTIAPISLAQQLTGTYWAERSAASGGGNLLWSCPRSNPLTGSTGTILTGQLSTVLV